jgi:uncharacterized protein YdhG (YjbR/CyaY superfamily)
MHPVDAHIATKTQEQKKAMLRMRRFLAALLPEADEVISYKMPAFKKKQVIVYYEAYAKHLGFYPTSAPIQAFENELKALGIPFSKGALRLPLQGEWPEGLIQEMVAFRLKQIG